MDNLRFRQIHLDFHTSPDISGIGERFDKKEWQERLKLAHVNSITCFSSCHHGWSYHPTKVGKMHPHLNFNLLKAQIEASKEIDVNVPIYLTAGVNNLAAAANPGWREVTVDGRYAGWTTNPVTPGFAKMCFNTPYLDYLCEMIKESAELFPMADGIFLDIISQGECCCPWCMQSMAELGFDPTKSEDRYAHSRVVLEKYYQKTTAAGKHHDPNMRVFHNSGHVSIGHTDILKYFGHLELESLPTGGWGYDHFPLSIAYCRHLGFDVMGMTGKFHTTWGEFGGFKHPNALRYECAAMIANGAKCSIGDQLHPCGNLDETTYKIIGEAYKEVAEKEAWCDNVSSVVDVAILASAAVNELPPTQNNSSADIGVSRLLLESQILFDIVDLSMDFNRYKVMILPDDVRINSELKAKLDSFRANGGKLILSGTSGLDATEDKFVYDIGATVEGLSQFSPNFIKTNSEVAPTFATTPFVMYMPNMLIKATTGRSLGDVYDPYFNRTYKHFCSHQHTPYKQEPTGYDCGVMSEDILYFAHPVFTLYAAYGAVICKNYVVEAIKSFLPDTLVFESNMPSAARATVMEQKSESRYVCHMLFANTITRGSMLDLAGGNSQTSQKIEVIEELNPLYDIDVTLRLPKAIKSATLEPQGIAIDYTQQDGKVNLKIDKLICHQMVVLNY